VTDYFSELKDQLAQVTEEGVHNRRRPLARLPRPRVGVLAAVASILTTVAVAAVALTTGGAAAAIAGSAQPVRSEGRSTRGRAPCGSCDAHPARRHVLLRELEHSYANGMLTTNASIPERGRVSHHQAASRLS
jgi:hypothetical protein